MDTSIVVQNTTHNPIYINNDSYTNIDNRPTCRICFESDSNEPLLLPCNCSQGYVHFNCLSEWIRIRGDHNFNICEICNHPYKNIGFNFKSKVKNYILILIWFYIIAGSIPMFTYIIIILNKYYITILYACFLIYITFIFLFLNKFSISTPIIKNIYRIN
jgi:E3 ubiquitin-protein ligase DOA10